MFDNFTYSSVPLEKIELDVRNPRLVTLKPLKTEVEIVDYMFAHERLGELLEKIASESRNVGAERPYVVKCGNRYTVIEGNRRIATYKLLTGLLKPAKQYQAKIPAITEESKSKLLNIECSIAPSRDDLLPIMASAHFGLGDKSKWGYLGSRKAVYDEHQSGRSVASLAAAFDRRKGQIRDYILEYGLYLNALTFNWSNEEREILEDPSVEFNPPIRFLQAQGHKDKVGIEFDRDNLLIKFNTPYADQKLQHLVRKLVIAPEKGLGATAGYDDVFKDFKAGVKSGESNDKKSGDDKIDKTEQDNNSKSPNLKSGALFNYPVTKHNQLIKQLAKEARNLNCQVYPAAGTFLLRNIVESILKHIIDEKDANKKGTSLSLESAIQLAMSPALSLPQSDKQVLSEFRKAHLDYVNLGSHANIIPNPLRLFSARDCIDQFIKRNI
ncbi:hypothetical protein [Sphingomonas sp. Leaf33]|uniref:hypothetical protein n=1 Tax=Sphingomonas sp. Leaf33 TaxID=1736215 RepID=UPI000A87EEE4|nr:hypothetical protein [Sphingomonas sp. Leaf33]